MISVATNNFESKCPVLNADVRVLLLSISSKLSLMQITLWVHEFLLFLGAGYLPVPVICWNFFLVIVKKWQTWVIYHPGNQLEITVKHDTGWSITERVCFPWIKVSLVFFHGKTFFSLKLLQTISTLHVPQFDHSPELESRPLYGRQVKIRTTRVYFL